MNWLTVSGKILGSVGVVAYVLLLTAIAQFWGRQAAAALGTTVPVHISYVMVVVMAIAALGSLGRIWWPRGQHNEQRHASHNGPAGRRS
jgi:hypothetical protein